MTQFGAVRDSCVRLLEALQHADADQGRRVVLDHLRELGQLVREGDWTPWGEFVVVPMLQTVQAAPRIKNSSAVLDEAFYAIEGLIGSMVMTEGIFLKTVTAMLKCVFLHPSASLSDATKRRGIHLIGCLFAHVHNKSPALVPTVLSDAFRGHLFCLFSNLIHLTEIKYMAHTSLESIVHVLSCFPSITRFDRCGSSERSSMQALANFFPGLASMCLRILVGDFKQGTLVFVEALHVLQLLITGVLRDDLHQTFVSDTRSDSLLQLLDTKEEVKLGSTKIETASRNVCVDHEWIDSSVSKIAQIVKRIMEFGVRFDDSLSAGSGHALGLMTDQLSWQFRLQQANLCHAILYRCHEVFSIPSGMDTNVLCIRALVRFSEDSVPEVRALTLESIEKLKRVDSTSLQLISSEPVRLYFLKLPRVLEFGHEQGKIQFLNTIAGFLSLSDGRNALGMTEMEHKTTISCVLQAIRLDAGDVTVLEAVDGVEHQFYEIRFQHIREVETASKMDHVCIALGRALGKSVHDIVDVMLEMLRSSVSAMGEGECSFAEGAAELVYLLTRLAIGAAMNQKRDGIEVCKLIIEEMLCPYIWDSREHRSEAEPAHIDTSLIDKETSVAVSNETNMHTALVESLAIRSIAELAMCMGPTFTTSGYIQVALFPLLQKLGREDARDIVASTALASLERIAATCSCSGIVELVALNADYIIDTVSFRLRYHPYDRMTPMMLEKLLHEIGVRHPTHTSALETLLLHITEDALTALDSRHVDTVHVKSFLRALRAVCKTIVHNMKQAGMKQKTSSNALLAKDRCNASSMLQRLYTTMECIDPLTKQPVQEYTGNHGPEKEDAASIIPLEHGDALQTIVESIITRCQHYISHSDPSISYLGMDIVSEALFALHNKDDLLLPIIAKLWGSMRSKFSDTDRRSLLEKTLDLVDSFGANAPRFLNRRFRCELWPEMKVVLGKLIAEMKQDSLYARPYFTTCAQYHLTLRILYFSLNAVRWNDFEVPVRSIGEAVAPFLQEWSCDAFCDIAMEIARSLCLHDADTVWGIFSGVQSAVPQRVKVVLEASVAVDETWALF